MSSNKKDVKMGESGQSQKKRKSAEQEYWNSHDKNNSNKVASTKNKTPAANEKKKEKFTSGKRKRPMVSLKHKQELDATEFTSDSEQYEIESVHSDSLKTKSVKMTRPVTSITPKSVRFKNLTLNKTPSRAQNSYVKKAHVKQLRINESGVSILSNLSESENNSLNQETRVNRPQNIQSTTKGALDDEIPLSFDLNTNIWNKNLTEMYRASQNRNIEFILDKSDSFEKSPPGEIMLNGEDIDISNLSEEFQSSNHEWDQIDKVTEPKKVEEYELSPESYYDDLSHFFEVWRIQNKINQSENLINNSGNTSVINSKENETAKDHTPGQSNLSNVVNNNNHLETQIDTEFTEIGTFYGLPLKVKDLIKQYKGINDLYDWQDECLKLEAIRKRKNLVYALPTSGGKTLVSEILILREIMCRKHNVLFVLPYVSIVQEKVWALSPFALALDFLVEEYAAGKGGYPPRKRRYKHSVYIATIEKALGLINSLMEAGRLKEIGLVVIDELHLMGEQGRGMNLETLLTKLMYARENIHVVGMSATIGNLPELCKFLKAEVYTKDFRPVELKEYVKCEKQIYEVNRNAKTIEESLVPARTVNFQYSKNASTMDPDRLTGLVMEVVPAGSCLVFCASKKSCENVATLLCRIMFKTMLDHKKTEKENLLKHIQAEGFLCPILKRIIPFGVAYHHSGLTSDERHLIEDAFRVGTLCVICCTSTLATGVNLPAQRVLLRSPYIGRDFIKLARYKQMVGRAGRAGMGEIGESILVCDKRDFKKVAELLCSPMDLVESKMCEDDLKGLRDLVLSSIALGTAQTRRTLRQLTSCTLLAVQETRLEQNVKRSTDRAISDLFKFGALQLDSDNSTVPDANISVLMKLSLGNTPDSSQKRTPSHWNKVVIGNDSKLVISKLGKAAMKGGLSLDTAHILYEDLIQAQSSLVLLSCLHLLYLVTPYDLAKQIKPSLPNYYSILVELGIKERQTAKVLGLNKACEAGFLTGRRIKTVNERVLNRFYLTLMLYDLWNEKPVFEVAEKYQVSRGLVQQLMVSAATFASNVMRFCEELGGFWIFLDVLKGMSHRLQHCSSNELLPLMDLPSVNQGRARQLYKTGFKSLQSIAKANPNDLMDNIDHMSRSIANQLIASAKLLLLERVENLREEAEDVLEGIDVPQNDYNS